MIEIKHDNIEKDEVADWEELDDEEYDPDSIFEPMDDESDSQDLGNIDEVDKSELQTPFKITQDERKAEGLKELRYSCDVCDYKNNDSYEMKLLKRNHKMYPCRLCIYAANTQKELGMHSKISRCKTFVCKRCEKAFIAHETLSRHMGERHSGAEIG